MTRKLVLLTFLVPACATMERSSSPYEPHASARLELRPASASPDDVDTIAPRLLGEPMLPTASSLKTQLLANRDQYDLGVRICVSAAGSVAGVALTRSSGDVALDDAAVHDIRAWQYERMPGPAQLQTCAPITIHYQP